MVIWKAWSCGDFPNGTIRIFSDSAWLSSPWTQDVWWTGRLGAHILGAASWMYTTPLSVFFSESCIDISDFQKKHKKTTYMTPCWNMLKLCQYLGSLSLKALCVGRDAFASHVPRGWPTWGSVSHVRRVSQKLWGYMMVTWVFPIVTFWWASIGLWNFLKLALIFFPSADSQKVCAPNLSLYQCSKTTSSKRRLRRTNWTNSRANYGLAFLVTMSRR